MKWIEIICKILPRVSKIDIPTIFYLIELSFQYSTKLPNLIINNSKKNLENPDLHPQIVENDWLLLLLLAQLPRYKKMSFLMIFELIKNYSKSPESEEIFFQIIERFIHLPGMEIRSQTIIELSFHLIQCHCSEIGTASKVQEKGKRITRLSQSSLRQGFTLSFKQNFQLPILIKISHFILFECFENFSSCREEILLRCLDNIRKSTNSIDPSKSKADSLNLNKPNQILELIQSEKGSSAPAKPLAAPPSNSTTPADFYSSAEFSHYFIEYSGIILVEYLGSHYPSLVSEFTQIIYDWFLPFLFSSL